MKTDWDDLIQGYQAGILDEKETKFLQERLKTDSQIRMLFLDSIRPPDPAGTTGDRRLQLQSVSRLDFLVPPSHGRPHCHG